jgi:hypothetical protein
VSGDREALFTELPRSFIPGSPLAGSRILMSTLFAVFGIVIGFVLGIAFGP